MAAFTLDSLRTLLPQESVFLHESAANRDDAIRQAGRALISSGSVTAGYVDAMLDREKVLSTFVGEGIAMPHGTLDAKETVNFDALALLRFPDGVEWEGARVFVVIAVAAKGRGYIGLISQLAGALLDPERTASLTSATTADEVYKLLV